MIRLNVFIQVEPGRREELKTCTCALVEASLKDKGCVAYDLFESATRPDVLMICETWQDALALKKHEQAAHFQELVPKIQSLSVMKVERFEF